MKIPVIVAHRGASACEPENTLAAFSLAWEHGADAIEGDFRMTADGHIVCMHDETTGRTGDRDCVVAEQPLRVLREVRVGRRPVPTLEDVLAIMPEEKEFFLEVKSGPVSISPILDILERSNVPLGQIRIISFKRETISEVVRLATVRAGWLVDPAHDKSIETVLAEMDAMGVTALHCRAGAGLNDERVSRIRAAGIELHVWTVDSPRVIREFCQLGVDSITTNHPELAKKEILRWASQRH
jgi:glycerophosphoryl diester phosphodiesterase